jgi:hypothetical protein
MNTKKALSILLTGGLLLSIISGCDKTEKSAEKAAKEVEKVATEAKENLPDADGMVEMTEEELNEASDGGGHSWDGWSKLGTQTIDGWTLTGMQYGTLNSQKDPDAISEVASVEIEITPPKGASEANAVRAWLGGKDADTLKQKLAGHSHGGATIAYYYGAELENRDELKFTVQIETSEGKEIFAQFELQE